MSNSISMTDRMKDTLDKFFTQKLITDVDRNTYLVCNLEDIRFKITISIVFMRDWNSIESDSYNSVIIENKGAVFTFPCYWISIPKELAMSYFEYIINDFYTSEVLKWDIAKNFINGFNADLSSNNTSCNCIKNQISQTSQCPVINAVNI